VLVLMCHEKGAGRDQLWDALHQGLLEDALGPLEHVLRRKQRGGASVDTLSPKALDQGLLLLAQPWG